MKALVDLRNDYLGEQLCVDLIELEELVDKFSNALDTIEELKTEIEDLQRDIEQNYTHIPFDPYDEYGISEDMFH